MSSLGNVITGALQGVMRLWIEMSFCPKYMNVISFSEGALKLQSCQALQQSMATWRENARQGFWSFCLKVRGSPKDQCAPGDGERHLSLCGRKTVESLASRKVEFWLGSVHSSVPAWHGTLPLLPRTGMLPSHKAIKEGRCHWIIFGRGWWG